MDDQGTHVVFGAGQIGSFLAESLLKKGIRVRVAKRTPTGIPAGAEATLGDAVDPVFCKSAVAGASVVYNCMNPPYSTKIWKEVLPRHLDNLIEAAGAAKARLVVMENLYMVGIGDGGAINEDTPLNPRSRKGEVRAEMTERLFSAHRRGDVQAVSGRASDYFGPRGTETYFADRFWKPALRGRPAEFVPNPDTPHTYHFIPDVAEGLAQLGAAPEEAFGGPWMLPCNPADTTRAFVGRLAAALGESITIKGMPKVVFKALSLVMPIVGEVEEMLHQWEVPFKVDDSRFRSRFGWGATDPAVAAAATVDWARATYGPGGPGN